MKEKRYLKKGSMEAWDVELLLLALTNLCDSENSKINAAL